MNLDIDFVRSNFPAFSEPSLQGQAFFENAGGSYACTQVIERLQSYYTQTKVQPNYPYPASELAGELMDSSYSSLANYLNVKPDEIHIGPSTTQNVYVLAQAFRGYLKAGDAIIVTNQDHEANSGAWRRLADIGVEVLEWRVDATGSLRLEDLQELLKQEPKLVCFPHCSNIIGEINPVKEVSEAAHEVGALSVVDGVSYAGHGFPNVADLGADLYMFSSYKTYGPHQGVMVVRDRVMDKLENQSHYFNDGYIHKRLVPAGPDHAQVAALQGVTQYFDALHAHHFETDTQKKPEQIHDLLRRAELERLEPLLDYLKNHPKLRIIGPDSLDPDDLESRAPTISLLAEGHSPEALAKRLAQRGVMCGYGHFYAARLLDALGIDVSTGVLRLSFVHYTSEEELEQLMNALDKVLG